MGGLEKALVMVCGRPLIEHVLDAMRMAKLRRIVCVPSRRTTSTTRYLESLGLECVVTSGNGFFQDLREALATIEDRRYVVCSCDVPLLTAELLRSLIRKPYDDEYVLFAVPAGLSRELGMKSPTTFLYQGEELTPSGVRLVKVPPDRDPSFMNPRVVIVNERRLAVNVNTLDDVAVAERLMREGI